MIIPSIKESNLNNKTVILRADFNVPLNEKQEITDDTRIKKTIPTIKYILESGAKLIIISHLGRPKGKIVEKLRLTPIAKRLEKLLDIKVHKTETCIGENVNKAVKELVSGEILLLENLRFYAGEKDNNPEFAKELADLANIYINDAFATSHRAHASMVGIPSIIPGYTGFLVEKEISALSKVFDNPKKPITIILGGAKVDTKIGIIKHFIEKADHILLGGALSTTFLAARGFFVAESKYEKNKMELAQEIMLESEKIKNNIELPHDAIVATDINVHAPKIDLPIKNIEGDMKIVDIGKVTIKRYQEIIKKSGTIIWNGPVGIYEYNCFSHGSKRLAEAIIESKATSFVGGGDTVDFLEKYNYEIDKFTHVSTAGGAMIEFIEGKTLPALKVLATKSI